MDKKKNFAQALEGFFAGKGFYIVLFLCVAVIGVSAWTMLAGDIGSGDEEPLSLSEPADSPAEELPAAAELAEPEKETVPVASIEPEEPVQQVTSPTPAPVEETPAPAAAPETVPGYFIRPVAGEIENGYSMDKLQYNRTMQDWRTHDGIDIAAELGAQVKAVADGRVEKVYSDDAMGTTVVLIHSGGLRSIYCNLAESPTVSEGDGVAAGSVIGSVGSTALYETGEVNHLHFAMSLDGESVDPGNYLP
ncbi:MAG: peptidoglycan DD-metalloendopeptidase family protein [Oscillospiraceae bacterium]|nr:peptidoglycan DD-metalloendopeptidase family protein [Oscillospiraceae bacterium]